MSVYNIYQYIITNFMNKNKYSYFNHPENITLELKGNSKHKTKPLNKDDYNVPKEHLSVQSRSLLLKKLQKNPQGFTAQTSVIPQNGKKQQTRKHSIKTFKELEKQNLGSGIDYLMQKTQNLASFCHKQKAHIFEQAPCNPQPKGKKHFGLQNQQSHQQAALAKAHKNTVEARLVNDVYSNVFRTQNHKQAAININSNNLFKKGEQLGMQYRRSKKISDNKMTELMGCEHNRSNKEGGLKQKRQDWRISNINFV